MSIFPLRRLRDRLANLPGKQKATLFLLLLCVILAGAFYLVRYQSGHKDLPERQPPTVSVTTVNAMTWQPSIQLTGEFLANQGITIKADAVGKVAKLNFHSGQMVQAGDILLEQDNTMQKGALDYAKAQLKISKITFERDDKLFKKGALSAQERDSAEANVESNQATVLEKQGDYDKTIIRAPFSGRLGLRHVSVGDFLDMGEEIVNLQNDDPLFIDFAVPEKYLADIKMGLKVTVLPDLVEAKQSVTGQVSSIESLIDSDTGTITVRSKIENPDHMLLPGGFATVTLFLGAEQAVLVVPQTALVYAKTGTYVFTVKDQVVTKHKIETGAQIGQDVVVVKGVSAGMQVVSAGTNKLHDHDAIRSVASEQSTT